MAKKRGNLEHINHLSRQAIDMARAEARKRARSDLTKLVKRREILVLKASTGCDPDERRKAANAIHELDACLLTLRHQLKHFRMASKLAHPNKSKSLGSSFQSEKVAKVTWARPYGR